MYKIRVERDQTGKKRYTWAQPDTGAMEKKMYGLPPAMAIDIASSYLLNKARLSLAEREIKNLQKIGKPINLVDQMADLLMK